MTENSGVKKVNESVRKVNGGVSGCARKGNTITLMMVIL